MIHNNLVSFAKVMSKFVIPPCSLSVSTRPDTVARLILALLPGGLHLTCLLVSLVYLLFHLFILPGFILANCPGLSVSECVEQKGPLGSLRSCLWLPIIYSFSKHLPVHKPSCLPCVQQGAMGHRINQ